jgi:tripartite-type tricarboxylate transporter receptor subunit TctC
MKKCVVTVSVLALLIFGSVGLLLGAAREYPSKPIQIILPHSAGGGIDLYLRLVSEELTKRWKVPVNVINKPGGGGAVAAGEVANAEKDGYTMLGMLLTQIASMTAANPKSPVNLLRDFDPIEVNSYASLVIVTRSESNLKSADDLIKYAKEKPGELIMGTSEVGSTIHLDALLFNRAANIKITIVPHQGTSEITPNVLGGHYQLGFINDVLAKPHLEAGKMRALISDLHSPRLNCPTFTEKGYPQVNLANFMSVLGPKGLPPAIIKVWTDTLESIVKDPSFVSAYSKLGYNIQMTTGTEKLNRLLKEEVTKYSTFTPEELGWKK